MLEKRSFTLIDGTFTPVAAAEILYAMISHKINFHGVKSLSMELRFGQDSKNSAQRFEVLKNMRNEVEQLIKEAIDAGYVLEIKGNIDIVVRNASEVKDVEHYM